MLFQAFMPARDTGQSQLPEAAHVPPRIRKPASARAKTGLLAEPIRSSNRLRRRNVDFAVADAKKPATVRQRACYAARRVGSRPHGDLLTPRDQQTKLAQVAIIAARTAEHVGAALLHPCDLTVRHLGYYTWQARVTRSAWRAGRAWVARVCSADTDPNANTDATRATHIRAEARCHSVRSTDRGPRASTYAVGAADIGTSTGIDATRATDGGARSDANAAATAN